MNLGSNNNNEHKEFAFDLNVKPVEDDNSDVPENSDLCTICIEPLVKTRDDRRTIVTLACGHKFHLDCIGSAFNAKGFMQCPNCMQIEPGQWRFANDPPLPNISEGDWITEEEDDDANSDRAQQSPVAASVGPNFSSYRITATGEVQQRAPPSHQLIFPRGLEPGVVTGRHYLAHPSFYPTPPVRNAPLFLPYPNTSTVQVNRIPSLFGDLPVPGSRMFSSGTEQLAGEIAHSWSTSLMYVSPSLFRSSSRAGGTSVNNGYSIGSSSSNGGRGGGGRGGGGRGGGGNGNRNGMSGGSHSRGCRPPP
ncbi:Uncharacterized protein Rs2_23777 [Raphanus sativus]|uniref:E3 ubiquitin-protein ligase RFI2 n=1 Tax=Raphanus sativus TaxID=3726 RepID=A0A6J0NZF0_RAPSA|nr:E3 ubiquitin-protein ligase RFI2 [Raphanus sativus]KAJ4896983.1 Uncharacterized protein Rs2_23777 [Raphanus sativus]